MYPSALKSSIPFALLLLASPCSAAITYAISEEAGGNNATGRNFAATLPGTTGWNSALTTAGGVPTTIGTTSTSSYASSFAGNTLVFGGGLLATIQSVDFSETPATLALALLGVDGSATLGTSGNAMQDKSPTPTGLTSGSPYFNDTSGSTSSRHGILFDFNQGVDAFGAFFGDLESANPVGPGGFTGTDPNAPNPLNDGSGRRLGEIYVYDTSGLLIGGPTNILASSGNYTVNGVAYTETDAGSATGAQTFTGAGNETTRHIGIFGGAGSIGSILFVVGDDDTNIHDGSDAQGNREFISTLGFQAYTGSVPEPSRGLLLALGLSLGVLRRVRV